MNFVFDLEGTLVHTDALNSWSYNFALIEAGFSPMEKKRITRKDLATNFPQLNNNQIENIIKRKQELFVSNLDKLLPNLELINTLTKLDKSQCILWTASDDEKIKKILQYLGMSGRFRELVKKTDKIDADIKKISDIFNCQIDEITIYENDLQIIKILKDSMKIGHVIEVKDIDDKILKGLELLLKNDGFLLEKNINERSITHKLGEYYQQLFPEWNVDCEFGHKVALTFLRDVGKELKSGELQDWAKKEKLEKNLDALLKKLENIQRTDIVKLPDSDTEYFLLPEVTEQEQLVTIFPDIIIHHRGKVDRLVAMEAKKKTNKNKTRRLFDVAKLYTLTQKGLYNYTVGIFLELPNKEHFLSHKCFQKSDIIPGRIIEYRSV